jgi:hypothetical protein
MQTTSQPKKKRLRKQKTESIYLSQFPSIYEGEYDQAMKDFEGYSLEALKKSFKAERRRYRSYPAIATKARIEAIIKIAKDRDR